MSLSTLKLERLQEEGCGILLPSLSPHSLKLDDLVCVLLSISGFLPQSSARALCMVNKSLHGTLQKETVKRFAAECIQGFWRFAKVNRTTKVLTFDFDLVGLNSVILSRIPFDDFRPTYLSKIALRVVKRLLMRILMSYWALPSHPALRDGRAHTFDTRIFVTAYVIRFFYTEVFQDYHAAEQVLFALSTDLVTNFELLVRDVKTFHSIREIPNGSERMSTFITCLSLFETNFRAWKLVDALKLADRITVALDAMRLAYVRLYNNVVGDGRVDIVLLGQVEFQTQRLRQKLGQVAGLAAVDRYDDMWMDELTVLIVRALDLDGRYNILPDGDALDGGNSDGDDSDGEGSGVDEY